MFGFVFGTLCLVGFVSVLRRRGWRRYGGCAGGHFGGGHFRRRGGWAMYRAFEALDTSPGQEKAIRGALSELRRELSELRPELDAARSHVAQTLASERFDAAELEASFERQLSSFGRIGPLLSRTLGQIHEALDPDQRRRLARFIEQGPGYCAA
ncbi:MAG: periplasmic heavy metal sensor [Deltaproteobacteria bacterium]